MPIVSESSNSPDRDFVVRRGTQSSVISLPDGVHRSQTGYRSRSLTLEEQRGIAAKSSYATEASTAAHLNEELELGHITGWRQNRQFNVNPRDFTRTTFRPTGLSASTTLRFGSTIYGPYTLQGAFGIYGINTSVIPAWPSEFTQQSMAGKLMRNAKPSVTGFNLARFAAEQRDAPALFRASNYRPRNYREFAGSYLNYLFGVKPTASDFVRMADLVQRSDAGVRRLLDAEKVVERTRRSITLAQNSGSGTFSQVSTPMQTLAWSQNLGPLQVRGAYLLYSSSGGSTSVMVPQLNWLWTMKQTLRQFATWEFFVPKPADIHSRLSLYKDKAKVLLGASKIKESDVYQLAPWTWLSDWFVDVGGLLQYQRSMIDDQIVASNSGYSIFEDFQGMVNYAGRRYDRQAIVNAYDLERDQFFHVSSSIQRFRHKRRGANPYSIGPTWNLSTQQWAILGALGLARGPNQPNIKV